MIGILGGIGRIAGREIAEEALGRIVAGRTTEDLFAREEIARRIGKASYDSLIKKLHEIQDERMTDDAKKKKMIWTKEWIILLEILMEIWEVGILHYTLKKDT